jgi:hypothetical protein
MRVIHLQKFKTRQHDANHGAGLDRLAYRANGPASLAAAHPARHKVMKNWNFAHKKTAGCGYVPFTPGRQSRLPQVRQKQ